MSDQQNTNDDIDNNYPSETIPLDDMEQQFTNEQLAVEGRGLVFHYGRKKHQILNNVDINVNKGTIYGLLGPSGCGKTTLLKCLMGRLKPKEGSVRLYGKYPGDSSICIPGRGIGYMPQELALYDDITVKETLSYFGRLYLLPKVELKKRIAFLLEFLEIPHKNTAIKNLSGGQKRRVSFACALVHEPPLLVLDEPTVGVDPLLRYSIWEHLKELTAKNHITIIITTHYVEEARKADRVGLMRDGSILCEMNPELLIQNHGVQTLEEVFWKLCKGNNVNSSEEVKNKKIVSCKNGLNSHMKLDGHQDEYEELRLMQHGVTLDEAVVKENIASSHQNYRDPDKDLVIFRQPEPTKLKATFIKTMAIMNKSFTCFRRNTLFAIFQILVPAFQVVLFCLCIGQEPFDLKLAIVNNETDIFGYSEQFLNTLDNKTFKKVRYDNLPEAISSVKAGESWGAMYIGPRFTSALTDRMLEGNNVENQTIIDGTVKIYLDLTSQQVGYTIYAKIMQAFQVFSKDMLIKTYQNPYLAESPVSLEPPVYGSREPVFAEFVAPGIILGITHMFAIGLTLLSIVQEKNHGLLDRFWVAGIGAVQMITAILSVLFVTMAAQIGLVIALAMSVFNLSILGSGFWVFMCVLLAGTTGMAYGLLVSAICKNEVEAVFIGLGSFYPIFLFSGMIWPLEGMPNYLRYFSYCLPMTTLSETMRSIIHRGWGITEHYVWVGCAVPFGWTIILVILACFLLKYSLSK